MRTDAIFERSVRSRTCMRYILFSNSKSHNTAKPTVQIKITHTKRFNYKKQHTMKCQALSKHTRHTPVVTDMLLQRFTIYHTRRCYLAFTSLHSIGSDLCPSSQALIHEDTTPAPPLHSYALIGQPARPRRVCSQCARGVSGALGGSSVRSGSAARAQYNEENPASPHRATLAKGVKEKERESLHLKISPYIWRGSPQPGGGTRDLICTVTFFFCVFFISFLGEGL